MNKVDYGTTGRAGPGPRHGILADGLARKILGPPFALPEIMFKLRLLDKLLLAFLVVSCLASGVTTVVAIQFFSERITRQALEAMRGHIRVAELVYQHQRDKLHDLSRFLASDSSVRNYTLFGVRQKLQPLLDDLLATHDVDHIAVVKYTTTGARLQGQAMNPAWQALDEARPLADHPALTHVRLSGQPILQLDAVEGWPDSALALTAVAPIFTQTLRKQAAGAVVLRYRLSGNSMLPSRIENLTGIRAAFFYQGRAVAHTRVGERPCIAARDYQTLLAGNAPLEQADLRLDGRLAEFIALHNRQGMPIAGLGVIASLEPYLETLREATQRLLFIMGLCLAGAFLLAYLLAKSILVPVKKLMVGVERIVSGDLDHHIPLKGNDELGVLAHSFNGMSRQLHDFFEVLKSTVGTLTRAGTALSSERNLNNLLELVVAEARQVSNADGGTLYTVEGQQLHFKIMQSKSQNLFARNTSTRLNNTIPLRQFESDINAYVAINKQVVCIAGDEESHRDAYPTPIRARLNDNEAMLVVPLLDRNHNTLGVLQLNTPLKEGQGERRLPFSDNQREIVASLASQAAVAIENARNHETIQRKNQAFQRFVPTEFLHRLGKQEIEDVRLGDASQEHMAVLFSDIRAFTSLSEGLEPQRIFEFLNTYLDHIGPCITRNGGFIDKFIGDAIMALFPGSRMGCADDALAGALAMLARLDEMNQASSRAPLRIGIGIHCGPLTLGTIGFQSRMESTVIGDTVNLASRVESLTKMYGITVGVTEKTLSSLLVPGYFETRRVDTVQVKGKREAHTIHELINADPDPIREIKLRNLPRHEEALTLYAAARFGEAACLFEELGQTQREDRVIEIYLHRCREYQQNPPPSDWDGITRLDAK